MRDVNFTKIPVDKPEGKKPFGRQRCMRKNNIKMNLIEITCVGTETSSRML